MSNKTAAKEKNYCTSTQEVSCLQHDEEDNKESQNEKKTKFEEGEYDLEKK